MKNVVKPIVVMLNSILFCGGTLAILSGLLYVSDDERIQRAINSIYVEEQTPVTLVDEVSVNDVDMKDLENTGVIKSCYKLSNGDFLVLSTGKKGYSNGTISCYVAIDDSFTVKKVVKDSDKGQTLMSKLTGLYDKFIGKTAGDDVSEVITGATFSSNAVSNSIYVALQFVSRIGG